ncbi:MAG: autotransporter outer membrane beta-barrel domain-containing protein [Runella slithyformis]|nr:MAG: autotransporter outer membrane beta-barrel domain-containing protein [Runella slithyformis]TAF29734.1 MAG: autotransporter outer membrane beta-barrel domain-containing protein [Runella slithyformis]TAF48553.1 MAG: autotransporter outer membrane beta-barrel domain-containing protein [Runella slithyformis]TAF83352.1 MAG: autotransporter outer membrane beta-barrel domain-containing protein [Runella slithyformis]
MKYLYTFLVLILLCSLSSHLQAQIEKGDKYIWGGFTVPQRYFNSEYPLSYAPEVSYLHFYKKDWAVASSASMRYYKQYATTYQGRSETDFLRMLEIDASATIRKYYDLNLQFYPYVGAGLGINFNSEKTVINTVPNDNFVRNRAIWGVAEVGVMYPINSRFIISAQVSSRFVPLYFSRVEFGLSYALRPLSIGDSLKQIPGYKGRWRLGGGYSESAERRVDGSSNYDYMNGALDVNLGRFINDKTLIGGYISTQISRQFGDEKRDNDRLSRRQQTGFSSALYAQRFYGKGRLNFFINTEAGVSHYKYHNYSEITTDSGVEIKDDEWDNWVFQSSIEYGLAYFIGKHFIIESRLGYLNFSKIREQPRDIRFVLLNENPYFSVHYVFGGKK